MAAKRYQILVRRMNSEAAAASAGYDIEIVLSSSIPKALLDSIEAKAGMPIAHDLQTIEEARLGKKGILPGFRNVNDTSYRKVLAAISEVLDKDDISFFGHPDAKFLKQLTTFVPETIFAGATLGTGKIHPEAEHGIILNIPTTDLTNFQTREIVRLVREKFKAADLKPDAVIEVSPPLNAGNAVSFFIAIDTHDVNQKRLLGMLNAAPTFAAQVAASRSGPATVAEVFNKSGLLTKDITPAGAEVLAKNWELLMEAIKPGTTPEQLVGLLTKAAEVSKQARSAA